MLEWQRIGTAPSADLRLKAGIDEVSASAHLQAATDSELNRTPRSLNGGRALPSASALLRAAMVLVMTLAPPKVSPASWWRCDP